MEEPYWKDDDAIATAAYHGDMKSIKTLIQIGKDINAQDEYGETTLMAAIDQDYPFIALYLIDIGSDINLANNDGDYALDLARFHKKVHNRDECEVVTKLESLKASYNEGISMVEKKYNSLGDIDKPLIIDFIKDNKKGVSNEVE